MPPCASAYAEARTGEWVIDPRLKHGGLQLPREGCRVRRYDSRPAASTNVHSRVQVGMGRVSTRDTEEHCLRFSVRLLAMPAAATGLARVRGVDIDHPYTCQRRFVG